MSQELAGARFLALWLAGLENPSGNLQHFKTMITLTPSETSELASGLINAMSLLWWTFNSLIGFSVLAAAVLGFNGIIGRGHGVFTRMLQIAVSVVVIGMMVWLHGNLNSSLALGKEGAIEWAGEVAAAIQDPAVEVVPTVSKAGKLVSVRISLPGRSRPGTVLVLGKTIPVEIVDSPGFSTSLSLQELGVLERSDIRLAGSGRDLEEIPADGGSNRCFSK